MLVEKKVLLAIDPGNIESGWCVVDTETYAPLAFGKTDNDFLVSVIEDKYVPVEYTRDIIEPIDLENADVVVEMVASYGMAVGASVFETCVWIGRFMQAAIMSGKAVERIYRRDIKLHLCGQSRAKDANIRQALIDRFAKHDFKNGKGTKKDPDWFYGFKADEWAAYALAVCKLDGVCSVGEEC